jgi:hypothetical protein
MRLPLAVLALVFAAAAAAQSQPRPLPPGSKPLEEPPPPPVIEGDPAQEPQVTTRREGDNTIQEYRLRGRLYMVRVTPVHGRPYVLVDQKGDGQFRRQDNLDSGLRVPQWVLLEF